MLKYRKIYVLNIHLPYIRKYLYCHKLTKNVHVSMNVHMHVRLLQKYLLEFAYSLKYLKGKSSMNQKKKNNFFIV